MPTAFLIFRASVTPEGALFWDCKGIYYATNRDDRIVLNHNAKRFDTRIEPMN